MFFKPLSICAHVNTIVPQLIPSDVARSELGQLSIGLEANGTYWYLLVNEGTLLQPMQSVPAFAATDQGIRA